MRRCQTRRIPKDTGHRPPGLETLGNSSGRWAQPQTAALLCTEAPTMLCISPAQRPRSGVTRGGPHCWCCSQPPAASLEDQLFALKGFALHREPDCRRNTPTLPKPAANSTLRTATSSSRAQPVSSALEMGTSDGLAPAPSPPPGPSHAVLRGPGQQYLWLCVQSRGAAAYSLPRVPEDESDTDLAQKSPR